MEDGDGSTLIARRGMNFMNHQTVSATLLYSTQKSRQDNSLISVCIYLTGEAIKYISFKTVHKKTMNTNLTTSIIVVSQ